MTGLDLALIVHNVLGKGKTGSKRLILRRVERLLLSIPEGNLIINPLDFSVLIVASVHDKIVGKHGIGHANELPKELLPDHGIGIVGHDVVNLVLVEEWVILNGCA